jgi:hypothetical protein
MTLKRKKPMKRSKPKKREEERLAPCPMPEGYAIYWTKRESVQADFTHNPSRAQPKQLPGRSEAYKAFLRTKPCCVCGIEGRTEVAHQGAHGTGTKASDYDALPMCGTRVDRQGCHQMSHQKGMVHTIDARDGRGWWSAVRYFVHEHRDRLKTEYLEMLDKEVAAHGP